MLTKAAARDKDQVGLPESRSRRVRFSLGALLLLTAVLAVGLAVYRSYRLPYWKARAEERYQSELARRIARQIPKLPRILGRWSGQDLPKSDVPFDTGPLKGWLWRRYRDAETGKVIEVSIGVGPASTAESLPLGLDVWRGSVLVNQLLFTEPQSIQMVQAGSRELRTQVVNAVDLQGRPKLDLIFLRWAHWTEGKWQEPRSAEQYLHPRHTVLQVGLIFRRDSVTQKLFEPDELTLQWPEEQEFARLLFSEIDRWVPHSDVR